MLLRDRFTATIAALAVGALPLGGASAMPTSAALLADAQGSASNVAMATAPDFDPLEIVESKGLLQEAEDRASDLDELAAEASSASNEGTPLLPVEEVVIIPVTDVQPTATSAGDVYEDDNYGIVTGVGGSGTNAGFIVIKDSSAPTSFSFRIGDDGGHLELNSDGSVLVRDASGVYVNYIEKPWALDANGKEIATSYTVSGNTLTQTVSTEGAAYPVIADPTTGCGTGWCSIYFNRSETAGIAAGSVSGATAISVGCAAISKVLGGLCAIGFGIAAAVAQGAYSSGNCLGYFFSFVGHNPFVEPRGTNRCR